MNSFFHSAERFKTSQYKISAFHPQSNGSIKRSRHAEYLKHYINNSNWEELLNLEMFSYNTSMYKGMKFKTHELMFRKFARALSVDTSFAKCEKIRTMPILVIYSPK